MRFAARGVEELELLDALLVEIFHAEGDGDSYMAARLHSELGRRKHKKGAEESGSEAANPPHCSVQERREGPPWASNKGK